MQFHRERQTAYGLLLHNACKIARLSWCVGFFVRYHKKQQEQPKKNNTLFGGPFNNQQNTHTKQVSNNKQKATTNNKQQDFWWMLAQPPQLQLAWHMAPCGRPWRISKADGGGFPRSTYPPPLTVKKYQPPTETAGFFLFRAYLLNRLVSLNKASYSTLISDGNDKLSNVQNTFCPNSHFEWEWKYCFETEIIFLLVSTFKECIAIINGSQGKSRIRNISKKLNTRMNYITLWS